MHLHNHLGMRFRPSTAFVLFCILLGVLWLAGGASRADALGQVVVRTAAAALLLVAILLADRPSMRRVWPVTALLLLTIALPVLQLVPIPPDLWAALPGRAVYEEAARASGQPQPWRSWSIVPGATANAAGSLIIPFTTLVLVAGLREKERSWLPTVLLGYVAISMFIGLLQFSGAGFNNPFVNDMRGQVSGTFANRNHFALLLAFGCLLAPVWALSAGPQARWRVPVSIGLVVLFVLTILATGSRAGLGLGALGLGIGLALAHRDVKHALRRYPRWAFIVLVAGIIVLLLVTVMLSISANRAISIHRILTVDAGQDIRSLARPTILAMIETYFPMGSGLGTFDNIYRMHEPLVLLNLSYFNHAHNDFLEIALEAGLPGLVVLAAALSWWAWASARAWRRDADEQTVDARIGSSMLLLVVLASIFDYPARTPTIMAFIVLAAVWLCRPTSRDTA